MKKYVWNAENHKKRIMSMAPALFELICLVVALAMCCLSYDLQQLECFGGFNFAVIIFIFTQGLIWLIDVLVFFIICKVKHINPKNLEVYEDKKTS